MSRAHGYDGRQQAQQQQAQQSVGSYRYNHGHGHGHQQNQQEGYNQQAAPTPTRQSAAGASNICNSSSRFPGSDTNYHQRRTGISGSSMVGHNMASNSVDTSGYRSSSFGSGGVNTIGDGITTVSALTLLRRKRKRYESSSSIGSNHMISNNLTTADGQDVAAGNGHVIRLPPPLYLLLPPPSTSDTATGNSSMSTTTITNPSISQYVASSNIINTAPPTGGGIFEIGQGITEIAGEAGTGKTQLCLRLCVSCAMLTYTVGENNGYNGGSKGQNVVQSNVSASSNAWITPGTGSTGPLRNLSEQQAMSNEYLDQYQKQPQQQRPYHQSLVRNPYSPVPPTYSSRQELTSTKSNSATPMLPPQDGMQHYQRQQERAQQTNPQQSRYYYRAVYITMGEGLTPAQIAYRLDQMALSTASTSEYTQQQQHVPSILNRILTRSVRNEDELLDMIKRELPDMLQSGYDSQHNHSTTGGRIGLIVFDSIAGMFRTPDLAPAQTTETSTEKQRRDRTSFFARRSEILFAVSAQLRRLGDEYGVAFVMANQATSTMKSGARAGATSGTSSNTVPALGMSWSNCINTRFVLRRYESLGSRLGATSGVSSVAAKGSNGGAPPPPVVATPPSMFKRWVRVAKSPVLPPVSVPFSIEMGGGVANETPK